MQAIRVLRAQSRPASPSPAPFAPGDNNNSASVGVASQSHSHEENNGNGSKTANPITRIQNLSLTSFAKRGATPPPTPSPVPTPPTAIVQDGTYLNTLGMKLNEAATRSLAMPVVNNGNTTAADVWRGRKPIPAGRGRAFAVLIETELDASQGNANLRHAILRLLPRSLHVLVSNISTQLSQLLTSPSYIPTNPHVPLHATTLHALALAQLCAEILETFNAYKLGNTNPEWAVIRSHFDTIVTRVTAPLFGQLQMEMNNMLEPVGHASSVTSSPSKDLGMSKEKAMKTHPAIMTLAQNVPVIGRALRRYTFDSCASTQTSLATLLIHTVWHAMVQLSHRVPNIPESSPNNVSHKPSFHSLAQVLTPPGSPALKMMKISPPGSPPVKPTKKLTPPNSPPAKKRVLALPALTSSPLVNTLALGNSSGGESPTKPRRKSSAGSLGSGNSDPELLKPASRATTTVSYATSSSIQPIMQASAWLTTLALDSKALVDVLSSADLPRPTQGSIPREAVDETFDRLLAFRDWLVGSASTGLIKLLETVPEEVPLLIALPVLLGEAWLEHRSLSSSSNVESSMVGSEFPGMTRVLGYDSDEVYRRTVGCGFRRADEFEGMFASRVVERLRSVNWAGRVVGWLESRMGCD